MTTMEDKPELLYGQGPDTPFKSETIRGRSGSNRRESGDSKILRLLQSKTPNKTATLTPIQAKPASCMPDTVPDWSSLNCDIVSFSRDLELEDEEERSDSIGGLVLEGTSR